MKKINKRKKITRKMMNEYQPNGNKYGTYRTYCELNGCCDTCNPKVRFLCKVRNRWINSIQEYIIEKEIDKNDC